MSSNKKEKNQQVQVFIRVRPLNKQEGNNNVIEIRGSRELNIKHHATARHYSFDRVFGPESKQIDLYKLVAEPTVAEVIAGYNCTILAYGQTGTGKTYTMAGGSATDMNNSTVNPLWFEDVHAGIIPRTLAHMFDELRMQQMEYTVRVSYLELYNEEIFDLLSPVEDNSKLKLYDDSLKKGSVIVQGLTETTVNSKSEVYRILEKGAEKRRIASTLMNSQSSRSHTVFCITVHTKENSVDGEDLLKTGKLYLVDLAGSENIKQSGATDLRAREAFNINQSLLTLGRCIVKLTERSTHIPYRESKLTRLLQDSLGGRTKTTLIATVSPAFCNADETLNTLDYASRAKCITNKPEINQRLSKKALLKEYTEEIDRLRKDLQAARMGKGVYLDKDNYDAMLKDLEIHREEITEKIGMIRVLQEDRDRKVQSCQELKISLECQQKEVQKKSETINNLESKLEEASKEICNLAEEKKFTQFIVEKHSETEQILKTTAKKLINVVDVTTSDTDKLHNKLDVLNDISKQNQSLCEQYIADVNRKIYKMYDNLNIFTDKEDKFHDSVLNSLKYLKTSSTKYVDKADLIAQRLGEIENPAYEGNDVQYINLNEARAKYSSEMQYLMQQGHENLETQFQTGLIQNIYELVEDIRKFQNFTSNLLANYMKSVQNNRTELNSFVDGINNIVTKATEDAERHIRERLNLCEQSKDKLTQSMTRCKTQQVAFEEKYKKAIDALEDAKLASINYFQTSNEQNDMFLSELHGTNESLKDTAHKIQEWNGESVSKIRDFSQFIADISKNQATYFENTEKMMTATSAHLDTKHDILTKNTQQTWCSVRDVLENIDNTYDHHHQELGEMCEQVHRSNNFRLDALRSHRQQFISIVDQFMNEINDVLKENEGDCSKVVGTLNVELEECREGIKKLFSNSLKEYKHTGSTPVRKRYQYPKTIVETKPREQLVEEYQRVRSSSVSRIGLTVQDVENIMNWKPGMPVVRSNSDSNLHKPLEEYNGNRTEPITECNTIKEKNVNSRQLHPDVLSIEN